jgi:hypothetical protein
MTRRTRAVVLVALAILVLGIGTAGVASYLGLQRFSLLGARTLDELALVPDDVEFVAYADVRQLMDSDLRYRLRPELRPPGSRDPLLEQTGIDFERDVDAVYVVVLPGSQAGPGARPLIVVRGRFDRSRIEALVLSQNGAVTEYRGATLATVEPNLGVAFVSEDVLAVGAPASVQRLLDARAGETGSIRGSDDVMRLVDRVADADVWTVGRVDALRGRPGVQNLPAQLPAMTWFAARGDVAQGVSAAIHAEARDAQAAEDLREIIRGIVALARVQVGQQPEFAELIDSIEMSSEGTTVSLAFSLSSQVLDKLGAFGSRVPAAMRLFQSPRPARAGADAPPSI